MSIVGLHAGRMIAARGEAAVRTRAGAHDLAFDAQLVTLRTQARLAAAGSFAYVSQANVFQLLADAGADLKAGDLVSFGDGRRYLLYADHSYAAGVRQYAAFFALRVNVTGLSIWRYDLTPGPAGGITNKPQAAPVAADVCGHFWRADGDISTGRDGRAVRDNCLLIIAAPPVAVQTTADVVAATAVATGDFTTVDDVVHEFSAFDARALDGLLVVKLKRMA